MSKITSLDQYIETRARDEIDRALQRDGLQKKCPVCGHNRISYRFIDVWDAVVYCLGCGLETAPVRVSGHLYRNPALMMKAFKEVWNEI